MQIKFMMWVKTKAKIRVFEKYDNYFMEFYWDACKSYRLDFENGLLDLNLRYCVIAWNKPMLQFFVFRVYRVGKMSRSYLLLLLRM